MSKYDLKAIHKRCSKHRDEIATTDTCGCFYCQKLFHPREIKEWTDQQTTAICPHCGIDSVLPSTKDLTVTAELLAAMEAHWFGD